MTGRLDRAIHEIPTGRSLPGDAWRDVLAVVAAGAVELESPHGVRLQLGRGDMFCVARVGPVLIRNTGAVPAVIRTVRRSPGRAR